MLHTFEASQSLTKFIPLYIILSTISRKHILESEDFDAKESETSYYWLDRTSNTKLFVSLG